MPAPPRPEGRGLRRRKPITEAYAALWWVERGHIPTISEAEDRVRHLRQHGPTPYAFTLRTHFPPGSDGDSGNTSPASASPLHSPSEDWACPV